MPTYRYNKSLPVGYVEGDGGQIVNDPAEYSRLSAAPPTPDVPKPVYELTNPSGGKMPFGTKKERDDYYAANSGYWTMPEDYGTNRYTGTGTTPATDPVADYYTNLKETYKMPDEARRSALRGEAEREVASQIAAIDSAYNSLIAEERSRQAKKAELGAAQVSGIGRLSGLGGSSVQAARQSDQAERALEAERLAIQAITAKQAVDRAQTLGSATAAAEARYKQEQDLAMQAETAYGSYIQSLAPKASGPVEVGGVLIDPATGKIIYDSRTAEGQKPVEVGGVLVDPVTGEIVFDSRTSEGKTFTLSPGQSVYGSDGSLIASNPTSATDGKVLTLSPGQIAYNPDGTVFAVGGEKDDDKLTTVPKGSTVIDSNGNVVYAPPAGAAGLSPLAQAVAKDGRLLSSLTGAQQGEILGELAEAGYDVSEIARGFNGLTEQQLTAVNSLNDKFLANQVVKDYQTVQDQTATVNAIVDGGSSGPRDLATVFAFMKALDPNSVVREAEYDNAAKSGNIFSGWAARFNGYLKAEGGFMPDNVKSEFKAVVNERLKAKQAQYDQLRGQFVGTARTLTGRDDADQFIYNVTTNYSPTPTVDPTTTPQTDEEKAYVDSQLNSGLPEGVTFRNVAAALGIPDDLYVRTATAMGGDPAKIEAWLKKKAAASGKDWASLFPKANSGAAAATTSAAPNVRRVASAIGQYESGGNYKALGPVLTSGSYKGDRAYGKYQVMGKNIPSWTREALGRSMTPQQFLSDPKAQDAVAEFKMGKLLAQYGNVEDVASVWFSGRPLAKAGNAKDQLGTSVPKYVRNVAAIYSRLS